MLGILLEPARIMPLYTSIATRCMLPSRFITETFSEPKAVVYPLESSTRKLTSTKLKSETRRTETMVEWCTTLSKK